MREELRGEENKGNNLQDRAVEKVGQKNTEYEDNMRKRGSDSPDGSVSECRGAAELCSMTDKSSESRTAALAGDTVFKDTGWRRMDSKPH